MPTGNLVVQLTDVTGAAVRGRIEIELRRFAGEPGTGGEPAEVVSSGGVTDLTITGIACRGGPGTLYKISASAEHFRTYTFFQLIQESRDNTASDDVEFWVKPGDVTGIRAPVFANLFEKVRLLLESATMRAAKPEDQDLLGLSGAGLYQQLGSLRKACLLNIATKAAHEETTGNCLPLIESLLLCRQDRFFAKVSPTLPERLRQSPLFRSAPEALHDPLPGFQLAEGSFKSRDAHANLQVTFMRDTSNGTLAADIDIDESAGIEHGFEVIHNALFRSRTNPYVIREFMISADPIRHTLTPPYSFVF
jgi:hypothetical protein